MSFKFKIYSYPHCCMSRVFCRWLKAAYSAFTMCYNTQETSWVPIFCWLSTISVLAADASFQGKWQLCDTKKWEIVEGSGSCTSSPWNYLESWSLWLLTLLPGVPLPIDGVSVAIISVLYLSELLKYSYIKLFYVLHNKCYLVNI